MNSVRVSSKKLDVLLRKAEELVGVKLILREQLVEMSSLLGSALDREERRHVDEDVRLLRRYVAQEERSGRDSPHVMALGRLLSYLEWEDDHIGTSARRFQSTVTRMGRERCQVEKTVVDVANSVRDVAMLPFGDLFKGLPRMVRDIAKQGNKEVDLDVEGEDIEIDRRILDDLRDVLTHLIRNAVDHGLEAPDEREREGKTREGHLRVAVNRPENGNIELVISDDGAGFDVEGIKEKAVKSGVVESAAAEAMTDVELQQLILEPGFSTSRMITEIWGRGLGMAIVR